MATNVNTSNEISANDNCKQFVTCFTEHDQNIKVDSCLESSDQSSDNYRAINRVNQRAQIDVINMQEYKTKKYRCFFVYEDQFSKYIILKALEKNCIDEVTEKLIDIFIIIGIPEIIQSHSGKDYAKNLVQQIGLHIPGVNIIHDNVMKDNHITRDFKNLIEAWRKENPKREWYEGLKYIQIMENIATNMENIKSPAAFILNEDILVGVRSIFKSKNSGSSNEFSSEKNEMMKQVIPIKTELPLTSFKGDKKMKKMHKVRIKETEKQLYIKTIGRNELHSNSQFDRQIESLQCDTCSESFQLIEIYEKHTLQCCNKNKNSIATHEKDTEIDEQYKNVKLSKKLKLTLQSSDTNKLSCNTSTKHNISDNISKRLSKRSTIGELNKGMNNAIKITNSPLLECKYCKHSFNFPSVLKRHIRTHTNERPYVCQICSKSFKQLGHLSQHLLTHTDYRSFQCTICGLKCLTLDTLKTHLVNHKEIGNSNNKLLSSDTYRLYECDNCKKVFTTKSVLERHIFTHTHERHFGCKICGKRFKQAGHVKSHMVIHTGERKFSCTICPKRFSLSNALKKHMYVHNGEKPYQCDVCGSRFLEKRNLNGHLMTHTNERPFVCKICGKRYTLADTLKRHVSAAHEDGRTYQCEICAKMFKQLAHLSVHKKVHTDERPFQCHLCDKNFKHKNVLKSHLAIHANIRPFECDICKATFVRKTNLQTHIASAHMNERPYICTICNKRFKQISHLNGHIVVHSNSMPYQCEFCERRCNRLDNLKKHMKLHTKIKH